MKNFKQQLSDFVDAECTKLMQHVHETLYPRKFATMWYRWAKFEWEFNHLEDGHCSNLIPTPKHPTHVQAWAGGKWAKAFVQLDKDNKVGPFLQF